ncbi:hypothetical protein MPER_10035, partial [Moniliophthora perniciosa FA553]
RALPADDDIVPLAKQGLDEEITVHAIDRTVQSANNVTPATPAPTATPSAGVPPTVDPTATPIITPINNAGDVDVLMGPDNDIPVDNASISLSTPSSRPTTPPLSSYTPDPETDIEVNSHPVSSAAVASLAASNLTPASSSRNAKRKGQSTDVTKPKRPRKSGSIQKKIDICPPDGAPQYVLNLVDLCCYVGGDDNFVGMVKLWLDIDAAANFADAGQLTANGRPSVIHQWIKRARKSTYFPDIPDLTDYQRKFVSWFEACSPSWRKCSGVMLRKQSNDWSSLHVTGPNGIASIVAALAFWRKAVYTLPGGTIEKDRKQTGACLLFESALGELDAF